MTVQRSIVAIDQGTTSTRAIRFDRHGRIEAVSSRPLKQVFPGPTMVEQDPEDIWQGALATLKDVLNPTVSAIGIANQRETIILWDRITGKPLYNALGWQDRRTASWCSKLVADGVEPLVMERTGLLLDPYFSASKLAWLLNSIDGARYRAERGELAAGTVDSFLLWRLTGGRIHATDVTNASRTMLFNIVDNCWDADLLAVYKIPANILPDVYDNTHIYGETDGATVGVVLPVAGMAGDQQAALIGQRCFKSGSVKSTYGTGCFMLANIGSQPIWSRNRLLTTPAYRIGSDVAFAMEGSIFIAGAAIKWLRDSMGLIVSAEDTARLAASVPDDHGVHLVPGFVGLGAPYWRTDVRAAIIGMTLDTTAAHVARAALEAVAFQTADLLDSMTKDGVTEPDVIRIDGGMATNDWFAQFLADILGTVVERPKNHEATALGAAYLAGLAIGLWADIGSLPHVDQALKRHAPKIADQERDSLRSGWRKAVQQVLSND